VIQEVSKKTQRGTRGSYQHINDDKGDQGGDDLVTYKDEGDDDLSIFPWKRMRLVKQQCISVKCSTSRRVFTDESKPL
jgi:hypothetical protein